MVRDQFMYRTGDALITHTVGKGTDLNTSIEICKVAKLWAKQNGASKKT